MFRLCSTFLLILLWVPALYAAEKPVIGWVETVRMMDAGLLLEAKIDTGADNSSVHIDSYTKYMKDGNEWIRFLLKDSSGKSTMLERRIERYAKIKRKMALPLTRPVVRLAVCLGTVRKDIYVNLARRKKFKYKMLIGRNFLRDSFLVDVSHMHTIQPGCES